MNTWHTRLAQALTARGKVWSDLVTITKKTKPAVYAWKPDATVRSKMMDGDNTTRVCNFLQINPMWLFFNEGESGLDYQHRAIQQPVLAQEDRANYNTSDDEQTLITAFRSANPETRRMMLAMASSIAHAPKGKPSYTIMPSDELGQDAEAGIIKTQAAKHSL